MAHHFPQLIRAYDRLMDLLVNEYSGSSDPGDDDFLWQLWEAANRYDMLDRATILRSGREDLDKDWNVRLFLRGLPHNVEVELGSSDHSVQDLERLDRTISAVEGVKKKIRVARLNLKSALRRDQTHAVRDPNRVPLQEASPARFDETLKRLNRALHSWEVQLYERFEHLEALQ